MRRTNMRLWAVALSFGVMLLACGPASPAGPRGATPLGSPSPTLIPMPTTALLSAPSSDVVWALIAGSALYRSNDRGDSWEQRPLPTQNISPRAGISFVDDQQGWLSTGGSPETQCNGEGTEIWHTTEGGSTWQRVALVNGLQPDPTGIGYAQCKEGLSFIDATHGFLAAWDDNTRRPSIGLQMAGIPGVEARSLIRRASFRSLPVLNSPRDWWKASGSHSWSLRGGCTRERK
jgi:hypothetical protein